MMKVLLINPSIASNINNKDLWVPINIMYIGAVLEHHNIDVKIVDMNLCTIEELISTLSSFLPSIIGITSIFSGQFLEVMSIAKQIKQINSSLVVAVGGIHPTLYPKDILNNCSYIDWIILGEGENSFLETIKHHESKEGFSTVDGIVYRENGEIKINEKKKFITDLDNLPLPSYNLINIEDYKIDTSRWHNPKNLSIDYMIPILSSRSCAMRCNFCSMFLTMGIKQRLRSPSKVVDEIEYIYDRYGCQRFAFIDDNLTSDKEHIISICKDIVKRNINIQFETPNGISLMRLDEEMIDWMVRAGLIRVSLAIESGSDFIRNKIIGKHLSKEKIYEVVDIFKKYPQVFTKAFFIIGMPEDTVETLNETYNMVIDINADYPCVSNLLPFPGTRLFDQIVRDNLFVDTVDPSRFWDSSDFYFTNNKKFFVKPYNMEIEELNLFRKKIDDLIERERKCPTNN